MSDRKTCQKWPTLQGSCSSSSVSHWPGRAGGGVGSAAQGRAWLAAWCGEGCAGAAGGCQREALLCWCGYGMAQRWCACCWRA